MTTTQAIDELRRLKGKFRTARSKNKGSDCLKPQWESALTRHIAKEGCLWLAMPSKPNEYQGGVVWLAGGMGACAVPGKPELQYDYAAALIPAAEAIRDLFREGGDIVQRIPILESLLRPIAGGPYETADLGRWWLALLFREVTPKVSYNEADGTLIYGATLDKDVCIASEAACDKAIAILKSKKRAVRHCSKIKFFPVIIPPDEPHDVPEAKAPDVTPSWLFEIRDEVADLVRDQRLMERFRVQLRVWSDGMEALKKRQQDFDTARDSFLAEREKQHPVRRKKSQTSPTWLEDTAKQNKQGSKATVPSDWLQEPWHRDELPTLYVWVPPEFQRSRRPQWRWPLPIGTQTLTSVEEFVALAAIHDWLTEESENRIDPWPNDAARGPFNYFVLVDSLKEKPLNDDEQRRLQRALQHVKEDIAGRDSKRTTPKRDEVFQWMREAFQAVLVELQGKTPAALLPETFANHPLSKSRQPPGKKKNAGRKPATADKIIEACKVWIDYEREKKSRKEFCVWWNGNKQVGRISDKWLDAKLSWVRKLIREDRVPAEFKNELKPLRRVKSVPKKTVKISHRSR